AGGRVGGQDDLDVHLVGFWQGTLLRRRLLRFHSIGNHSERAGDRDRGQEKSCHNEPPYATTVGRTLTIKTSRTPRRITTERVFASGSNDRVQQRGRLQRLYASENRNAGPVCCNGWLAGQPWAAAKNSVSNRRLRVVLL